ncbi:HlyD family type I secretion periplasmic adaptor subunit (plasmid) [Ensifer adhaerens]|uniref:HlyD family type I secretion periplasmic adaptor subunit n=1 Tax=Ensifer TaxID=106591 RepID=UPI002100E005|nr:HlyD family type I secretion periplasmic adaptor subunit [Ensifer adhaerens]UTV39249.1 HlyD family type I secretion periplasmic adaptor subunit [Ensifer adhaerens]
MTRAMQSSGSAIRVLRVHSVAIYALALALVGGVAGWAYTTELSNAVVASGVVTVEGNAKSVQHLSGGIVGQILVAEGEEVYAGQILLRLDGTVVRSNFEVTESSLAHLYARRARLLTERAGDAVVDFDRALDGVRTRIASQELIESERQLLVNRTANLAGMKQQLGSRKAQLADEGEGLTVQLRAIDDALSLIADELVGVEALYRNGLTPIQRVTALKRQRAELEGDRGQKLAARAQVRGRSDEIDLQMLQLDEDRRVEVSKELSEIEVRIVEFEERRTALMDQLRRLDIVAPISGRVHQLAVHTVNGVINPGEMLMQIIPNSADLELEARLAPKDIDQVRVGQAVNIRFTAFNQRTTPEVSGQIKTVAPDLVIDKVTGISSYLVRIQPHKEDLARADHLSMYPGMPAEVFIQVSNRTVLSYLTKPLADQLQRTFREE